MQQDRRRQGKLWLSVLTAICGLPVILGISDALWLEAIALILFACLVVLTVSLMRAGSYLIIAVLVVIGIAILPSIPDMAALREAGQFVLVFGCLMPVLTLIRATATSMPSVWQTQKRLAELPANASASGLQLTAHILGGVLNIGTFALISASVPKDADDERRRIAAEAVLRGMNSAVIWSPFFVSFAVGTAYLPAGIETGAILAGIVTAALFFMVSVTAMAYAGGGVALIAALLPLTPIASRLAVIFICVIVIGYIFNLTALLAVIVTMPILCAVQIARRPDTARQIASQFSALQRAGGDEFVIISISMVIAALATGSPALNAILISLFGEQPELWLKIWMLPVIVWICSLGGIHPVISSAPLLGFFAPMIGPFEAIFVMQAHMIGWAAGTMTSFSSMSVVTVAEQFSLRPMQLAFGRNLMFSAMLAIGGGGLWAGIYSLMAG